MELSLNWINLLILFGALNALVFSIILLFQKEHPGARFLAAFVFVLAYNGFETLSWSAGLDEASFFFDLFTFIVIYAVGPSFYLYLKSLLYPELNLTFRSEWYHYGFVLFQLASRIFIVSYHLLLVNEIFVSDFLPPLLMDFVWSYAEPGSVLLFLFYFFLSVREYRKATSSGGSAIRQNQSAFAWARMLLIAMSFFAIAWPVTVLVPYLFSFESGSHYYPIELALALFTYWIIIFGYHNVRIISRKVRASLLPPSDLQKCVETLLSAMEKDRLFLNAELTLSKLAAHTGLSAKIISSVLNQYCQSNFNDFVNGYRIKEVSQRLLAGDTAHLTISGIAFESGFNSQATFQRVFKNKIGVSPKEYLNLNHKKSA